MTATIDVLIPAYNAQSTIASAIESIQTQSERDIVIHVVDDGSTDSTGAILAAIAANDSRVRVYTKANGGIVEALNDGLRHCTAEFVARHDADDLAYPDRFAVQLAYLRAHADVVAVGAAVRHIDVNGTPTGSIADLGSPDLADPFFVPSREPYIIHPFLMVRRAAIDSVGGYRHVHGAEDTDLYWRLRTRGRLQNLHELLGDYRLHDLSISGGSILNGRIMAVSSQLAALSARRHTRGVPDISFTKASLSAWKAAGSLAMMLDIASEGLDPTERAYLTHSTAAKLLELASYRPYEPDAADCVFIGDLARTGFASVSPENRALNLRRISGAAARIAASGRLHDAFRMLPPSHYPSFILRYLARLAMPETLRRRLRLRGTKESPSK